jgi:hypothetical protein
MSHPYSVFGFHFNPTIVFSAPSSLQLKERVADGFFNLKKKVVGVFLTRCVWVGEFRLTCH